MHSMEHVDLIVLGGIADMSERVSPFAALTGAEKQIKWLEYQSIRLPYIEGGMETSLPDEATALRNCSPKKKREPERLAFPSLLL